MSLPLRAQLAGIEPYGAPQLDVDVCLNVNENPYAPSPQMVAAITRAVEDASRGMNRYPDRDAVRLRQALADYLNAEAGCRFGCENLWAANGSNEVMVQLLQAFGGPGRTLITAPPTYSMYSQYARDTFTELVQVPRRADYAVDLPALEQAMGAAHAAVVLLPSPNNPTGTPLGLDEVSRLARAGLGRGPVVGGQRSDTLIVIDEAYAEFRPAAVASAATLVADHPNVVVTRTMSKAFGMAGLRLGYAAACKAVVDALMVVRLPYHLSAITQAAAIAALGQRAHLTGQLNKLRRRRDALVTTLREMGLTVADTDANFCLFGPFEDRDAMFRALLERGVLVRQVGPEGYLRVSVGTGDEDARFVSALREVLA